MGKRRPKVSESPALPKSISAEPDTAGKQQFDAFADIQAELFSKLHHANLQMDDDHSKAGQFCIRIYR